MSKGLTPPAVVLPKLYVVFLAFGSFFLPFYKRDFRLKKRSKCPSWRSSAFCRTRCQGRVVCVHGSGAYGLDRPSGRGSALLRQEGQEKEDRTRARISAMRKISRLVVVAAIVGIIGCR